MDVIKAFGGRKTINDLIARGDRCRDARDWPSAARYYREALDLDGGLAPIWVQYGHALKETGKYSDAEKAYGQALEIEEDADTHLQLGHLLKITDRKSDAIESYRKALQFEPNNPIIKREIESCEQSSASRLYRSSSENHIYFDISDLIFYVGHHDNLTGIQRVQASIILSLLEIDLNATVHFLDLALRASSWPIARRRGGTWRSLHQCQPLSA